MAIGIAATLGPRPLPALGSTLRPLQTVVRAGYAATRSAREMIAEAGEQFEDMVAEARAAYADKEEPASPIVTPAAASTTPRRRSTSAEPGGNQYRRGYDPADHHKIVGRVRDRAQQDGLFTLSI